MNGVTGQAKKAVDSQSTLLRSRQSVRPSDPGYDAHVLAHIKAKVVIDPVTGCWLWQGFVQPARFVVDRGFSVGGYGSIGYRGRNLAVHRVVWMCLNGPQPPKMDVCHTCDVRHCCNPDHLWLGTHQQNMRDMAAKGRGLTGLKAAQTHCIRGHELTRDNIYLSNNGRRRSCKTCDRYFQRLRMGWSADEALHTPPIPQGEQTARRIIGTRNRGSAA
jgi:hypothetical protein